ncbi:MAG: DivIVA domain-containing protein, partial [Longimicrobiales bacterium]
MIDMTPLDVRNKRGDFKKIMRGYDPQEVDIFLELVAERLEALVREAIQLRERSETLQVQVDAQTSREQAVQDALVTAQELRAEMQNQAQREAENIVKEAQVEARQILAAADTEARGKLRGIERRLDQGQRVLDDLERSRSRFLKEFRSLLEREIDVVSVEEGRAPLEDRAIDLDLGVFREQLSDASE